ncbi:MAG TPA: hypothetical protein VGM88_35215 [Kofleriaceae bacterium]
MRARILVLVVVAACGRLGFDSSSDGGAGDGGTDGSDGPAAMGRWAQVGVGEQTTCAVTIDGQLWCWGAGWSGELGIGSEPESAPPTRVGTDSTWHRVAIHDQHACALETDDSLWCWGSNNRGDLGTGAPGQDAQAPSRVGTASWISMDVGEQFTCGIQTDHSLWCWGSSDDGRLGLGDGIGDQARPARVGTDADWLSVQLHSYHACAMKLDSSLWCWGAGYDGEIGNDDDAAVSAPTQIGMQHTWQSFATGESHTCALDTDGLAWCWGDDEWGQLGDGDEDEADSPVRASVPALATIFAGASNTCGATTDGSLYCWGAASRGAIPGEVARAADVGVPVATSPIASMSIGGNTACTIDTTAHLACTGDNFYGQAGQPTGEEHVSTVKSDARTDWTAIWAHETHACGRTSDDNIWCWGTGGEGQDGDDAYVDREAPVSTNSTFDSIVMSYDTTIGVDGANASIWGYDGWDDNYPGSPQQLGDVGNVAGIAIGADHGCWINGTAMHCAGDNDSGQLGDGTTNDSDDTIVAGAWIAVIAAHDTTCAADQSGDLYCWGDGEDVGADEDDDALSPVAVAVPVGYQPIAATLGYDFGCGIFANAAAAQGQGRIFCWGQNYWGQLGDGTRDYSGPPVPAGDRNDWIDIDAGDYHTCAIASDHSLWCWGHGDQGQQGDPALLEQDTPARVGTEADWVDVACGVHFTCAIRQDGTRACFGQNSDGELGNNRAWLTAYVDVP